MIKVQFLELTCTSYVVYFYKFIITIIKINYYLALVNSYVTVKQRNVL